MELLGGTSLEQRAGARLGNRLGATFRSQFSEQIADMFLDRGKLDYQGIGDLLIGGAIGKQAQDLLFTLSEWFERGG